MPFLENMFLKTNAKFDIMAPMKPEESEDIQELSEEYYRLSIFIITIQIIPLQIEI